jgi:UrcA family protein
VNWIFALAAFSVVGCTASPQSAQTAGAERAVREGEINMSNIDTFSEVSADRLLRRILSAALANCRIDPGARGTSGDKTPIRTCLQASMRRDVARVEGRVVAARFARIGATMIEAATSRDFASADVPEPVAVQPVIANLTPVSAIKARPEATTDELNRRESARLRALISSN